MSTDVLNNTPIRARRAEGISAGCLPLDRWLVNPAHELPGRRCPILPPPPQRSLLRRVLSAVYSLGLTIATGAGLMVLAQYLTTPA